jgi:hypothetical protein
MQRRILITALALAALLAAPAAHAAGGGQDPLLSGYGSPGTGEQYVLPPPAAGTGKAARAASRTLDPAVTESPQALAAPVARTSASTPGGGGAAKGTRGQTKTKTTTPLVAQRVSSERAIIAVATRPATAPLFTTLDLALVAFAGLALAGFALATRSDRRHG